MYTCTDASRRTTQQVLGYCITVFRILFMVEFVVKFVSFSIYIGMLYLAVNAYLGDLVYGYL